MALVFLGTILYGVLGHKDVSAYLLLPHYANGPAWAMLAFSIMEGSSEIDDDAPDDDVVDETDRAVGSGSDEEEDA